MANMSDVMENQTSTSQSNNYVTVIPVDYSTNLIYNSQSPEYIVDQYSDFSKRTHDDYIQTEDMVQNDQGALYSVSQRVQPANTNYSNVCPQEVYVTEQKCPGVEGNWNRDIDSEKQEDANGKIPNENPNDIDCSSGPPMAAISSTSTSENANTAIFPTCVYLHDRVAIMLEIEDSTSATVDLMCNAIVNADELGLNKQLATQLFTLWMYSSLLELQLKPTHKPYEVRRAWRSLIEKFSHGSSEKQLRDEPVILFQRNVFFPQHLEEKIKDQRILELLYEEARRNILEGRYPCEVGHYIMLGGIQARIELGPYNSQVHSTHYFREEQRKYLPVHVRKSSTWTWLPISSKNSAEVRLLEQFKRIPISATNRKLMRKYLEFCWSLPFYGAAFFEGQVEQPVRGLTSLITHQDIPVLVGINSKGVHVIDDVECTLLLGLRYEELSWDYARPSKEDDPNCFPCIFLQFIVVENGARVSKILQIFSRQASLMDTLISGFVQQLKEKSSEETDRSYLNHVTGEGGNEFESHGSIAHANIPHSSATLPTLTNKLSRLTLATFDEDGHCIGQMGSWSFSY